MGIDGYLDTDILRLRLFRRHANIVPYPTSRMRAGVGEGKPAEVRAMRWLAMLTVAGVAGCGGGGVGGGSDDAGTGEPEFTAKSLDPLTLDYSENPAAADEKYLDKVGRVLFTGEIRREGGQTIGVRISPVNHDPYNQIVPNIQFYFASKREVAKIKPHTVYTLQGICRGMRGEDVVFTGTRVIGEGNFIK